MGNSRSYIDNYKLRAESCIVYNIDRVDIYSCVFLSALITRTRSVLRDEWDSTCLMRFILLVSPVSRLFIVVLVFVGVTLSYIENIYRDDWRVTHLSTQSSGVCLSAKSPWWLYALSALVFYTTPLYSAFVLPSSRFLFIWILIKSISRCSCACIQYLSIDSR